MEFFALSDIGRVRSQNEDSYEVGMFADGSSWAVVCDGMGGASGGTVASKMCAEGVCEHLKRGYREKCSVSSLKNILISSIMAANASVFEKSQSEPFLDGMGTTVVAAVLTEHAAIIAHVGDSRAYLLRNGVLNQITKDHSMVQYLVDIGKITPEEALVHPDKNVITRAVGVEADVKADVDIVDVEDGDVFIICTDGLSGYVSESEILSLAKSCNNICELPEKLVNAANSGGGRDNITVAVAECKISRESQHG